MTITLSGSSTGTATTDSSGNYSFSGLANGNYTVTPSLSCYTFSPTSSIQTVNGANITGINFVASLATTSSIIGPSGGTIEVTDLTSLLYGVKVEIPEGALENQTNINVISYSESELTDQIEQLPDDMRFMGGIKIDAGGVVLNKPITISLPNSFGATVNDQLLVGEIVDLDGNSSMAIVYTGLAHIGSVIFNAPYPAVYAVLSPTSPLGLVSGTLTDQSRNPISNGIIASFMSGPFIAKTNAVGYYEIPAGPAGSSPIILGMSPPSTLLSSTILTDVIGGIEINIPKIILSNINFQPSAVSNQLSDNSLQITNLFADISPALMPVKNAVTKKGMKRGGLIPGTY